MWLYCICMIMMSMLDAIDTTIKSSINEQVYTFCTCHTGHCAVYDYGLSTAWCRQAKFPGDILIVPRSSAILASDFSHVTGDGQLQRRPEMGFVHPNRSTCSLFSHSRRVYSHQSIQSALSASLLQFGYRNIPVS